MKKNPNNFTDREFQELAALVNSTIVKNDGLVGNQEDQVELVVELEKKFKYHM